ncbi:efflux RND transporter periplasmic adaptor subunit [Paraburkholderia phosphatilytica]|uniref:efflux RND transporter periplasmic adaptor subunit n=1 Tax=Paraburkholderia phosphatilytica TaxID=2282883 RepID=UPI000E49A4FC|nr:efflux RND transporter periplasmic adaptor subunit [Paraburkholderia phosphatilytica]
MSDTTRPSAQPPSPSSSEPHRSSSPPPSPPSGQPPAKRRHTGRWVLIIIVLILIVLVVLHILRQRQPKRTAAVQVVTVSKAALGAMPETLSALGTVTPVATVTVLPQLSGYLTSVPYTEGEDVKKGQLLAQIDDRQYQISRQQEEAQLAKDKAALGQAHSDLARYQQLSQQKSIAEQTYVDQQFTVQQDEAAVKADMAAIAQYNLDIEYCHITSPVSGRVGLRLVDPGNYVTASSTTGIAVVTTMQPTTVEFAVPQDSLGKVLARFNTGAKLAVTAYSSDNSRQIETGTLYAISNQMTTSTGTVTLRASFPNADNALFPNEFVNVKLLVDTMQNAVLVPTPAVQSGAPGNYVYLVNPDSTVSVHKVTIGPSDGTHTVIASGLNEGDTVVTDGMDRLSDGAKIRAAAARPASGAAGASGAAEGGASEAAEASGASGAHAHRGHAASGAAAASQAS